jgi:putative two-component system response regulator
MVNESSSVAGPPAAWSSRAPFAGRNPVSAPFPQARLLVIDDHEGTTEALGRILKAAGYQNVTTTNQPRKALVLYREVDPDIILLDLRMPHLDGFAVMRQIRARDGSGSLPILVITGDSDAAVRRQALASGATDFLQKPFDGAEVVLRVRNLLQMRFLASGLEDRLEQQSAQLRRSQVEIAQRLALAAELRDYQSGEHTQRVGHISGRIADALGMPADQVETIRLAAPLHDIGKIAIPDHILLKPAPLTLDELEIVKRHTSLGARMLSGSESEILQQAEEIALYHHENWDGTGYTPGLDGDSIPIAARIVRVADVFDALVHERPYKSAWTLEDTIEWITEGAGTTFDPDVVAAFLRVQATEGLPRLSDEIADDLFSENAWSDLALLIRPMEPMDGLGSMGSLRSLDDLDGEVRTGPPGPPASDPHP